jgi:hypothetical protein
VCGRRRAVRVIVHVQGRDAAAGTLPRACRPCVRAVVVTRAVHLAPARKDAELGIVQRAPGLQPRQSHLAHGGTHHDDVMLVTRRGQNLCQTAGRYLRVLFSSTCRDSAAPHGAASLRRKVPSDRRPSWAGRGSPPPQAGATRGGRCNQRHTRSAGKGVEDSRADLCTAGRVARALSRLDLLRPSPHLKYYYAGECAMSSQYAALRMDL